jgi:hypothetical protein
MEGQATGEAATAAVHRVGTAVEALQTARAAVVVEAEVDLLVATVEASVDVDVVGDSTVADRARAIRHQQHQPGASHRLTLLYFGDTIDQLDVPANATADPVPRLLTLLQAQHLLLSH